MVEFRDYQKQIMDEAFVKLMANRFVYLSMEVRTGKTLTSMGALDMIKDIENVLFITKKKAVPNITDDYRSLSPSYKISIVNYESLHKIDKNGWDAIICDEAHSMGAYPKPSLRAKQVRELILLNNPYVILLSGTPSPESYSQLYHQVYAIRSSPFHKYKNFYRFADDYVLVTRKRVGGFEVKDYSFGKKKILEEMSPYMISFTQAEAGFESSIEEEILTVKMLPDTYTLCKTLKRSLVVQGKDEVILADTGAKLMSKLHQMYSGTVKFESGNSMVFDNSKALFIAERFKSNKIGVFYKFKEEFNALKQVFGDDLCDNLTDFDSGKCKVIALQIVSGREGISLRNADYIVFYNIDFSATSYWQARDRMTTKDRKHNKIYWIFSENGIEKKVHEAVKNKKDYTLSHFKRDSLNL